MASNSPKKKSPQRTPFSLCPDCLSNAMRSANENGYTGHEAESEAASYVREGSSTKCEKCSTPDVCPNCLSNAMDSVQYDYPEESQARRREIAKGYVEDKITTPCDKHSGGGY